MTTEYDGDDAAVLEARYQKARAAHQAARLAFFDANPNGDAANDRELTRLRDAEQVALSRFRAAGSPAVQSHLPGVSTAWANPTQLPVLWWVAGVALVGAVVCALASNGIDPVSYFGGVSESELATKSALAAWADILGLIGVVSAVGGIVLSGVVAALRASR